SDHGCADHAGVHGADGGAVPAGHRRRGDRLAGETEARRGTFPRGGHMRVADAMGIGRARSRGWWTVVCLLAPVVGLAGILAACAFGSSNAEKPAPSTNPAAVAQSPTASKIASA